VTSPLAGNPAAMSTSPIGGFLRSGAGYTILGSGDVTRFVRANGAPDTSTEDGGAPFRGARDGVTLRMRTTYDGATRALRASTAAERRLTHRG
jgi:hypothetical protein